MPLEHPLQITLQRGGFRDMTQIAESEPGMWDEHLNDKCRANY